MKAQTLLPELHRGGVRWGGAEWALLLPALCPVTCMVGQISFVGSLCSVCHSRRAIEVYHAALLWNLNE